MTEMLKQYIITETMLQTWRNGCVNLSNPHVNDDICKKCEYRGTGMRKECCDFDDNTMEKIFRSHPHNPQSEREKVITEQRINYLRSLGWVVAVHNDYKRDGGFHTFWLLTYPDGRYLEGEGKTDDEALEQIVAQFHSSKDGDLG